MGINEKACTDGIWNVPTSKFRFIGPDFLCFGKTVWLALKVVNGCSDLLVEIFGKEVPGAVGWFALGKLSANFGRFSSLLKYYVPKFCITCWFVCRIWFQKRKQAGLVYFQEALFIICLYDSSVYQETIYIWCYPGQGMWWRTYVLTYAIPTYIQYLLTYIHTYLNTYLPTYIPTYQVQVW